MDTSVGRFCYIGEIVLPRDLLFLLVKTQTIWTLPTYDREESMLRHTKTQSETDESLKPTYQNVKTITTSSHIISL
jgi:hypothetical protein